MALLSAFNPHEFSEQTVRTVATGREDDLRSVLSAVRDNLATQTIQHLIVSAPRGYGKSFMMRHVQIEIGRIARDEGLALAVVLMPEEMPHVKEPETLVRELTRALSGGAAADAELTWHEDDGAAWDEAVEELNDAIARRVGPDGLFVALVENFDVLLRRAFAKEVQSSRLRALLTMPGGRMMLVAASASGAFDRNYDHRLFQAFREIVLEPWTVQECLEFFDRQRIDANKSPLGTAARARAQAVATFIGGTPRLATLLGDALFDEDLLHAADLLHRLIDELTPYYKERIEALPGRAQKLLDALLRGGEPATQSELARRVKANSQPAIAAPFNDLVRERIVVGEKVPGSAEVLYRVSDRVFAHYYRRRIIQHGREACPLEALVDLLAEYFSPEEKRLKAGEFVRSGRITEARLMARLHEGARVQVGRRWMLFDSPRSIMDRLVPLASASSAGYLTAIIARFGEGRIDDAYAAVDAALASVPKAEDRVLLLLARSHLDAYEGLEWGLPAVEEASALIPNLSDTGILAEIGLRRVRALLDLGQFSAALAACDKLTMQIDPHERAGIAGRIRCFAAAAFESLGRNEEIVAAAKEAAHLAIAAEDEFTAAVALRLECRGLNLLGRLDEAVAAAARAADLSRSMGSKLGEADSLRWEAISLYDLGRFEASVALACRAADTARSARAVQIEASSLALAASGLHALKKYQESVAAALQAADVAMTIGDSGMASEALRIAALGNAGLGEHEAAVLLTKQATDHARSIGDAREELRNLCAGAQSLEELGRFDDALGDLQRAAELAASVADALAEAETRIHIAWNFAKRGDFAGAAGMLAAVSVLLDGRPPDATFARLTEAALLIGFRSFASFFSAPDAIDRLHGILRAVADDLDVAGLRQDCLNAWIDSCESAGLFLVRDPERLEAWADAVSLRFPGRFDDRAARLRDVALYHRSGGRGAALARLDPDLARTLRSMFPPAAEEEAASVAVRPAARRAS